MQDDIYIMRRIFERYKSIYKDMNDFIDPLIVAEKIAITEEYKFVTGGEISREIKEGIKGINGICQAERIVNIFSVFYKIVSIVFLF